MRTVGHQSWMQVKDTVGESRGLYGNAPLWGAWVTCLTLDFMIK